MTLLRKSECQGEVHAVEHSERRTMPTEDQNLVIFQGWLPTFCLSSAESSIRSVPGLSVFHVAFLSSVIDRIPDISSDVSHAFHVFSLPKTAKKLQTLGGTGLERFPRCLALQCHQSGPSQVLMPFMQHFSVESLIMSIQISYSFIEYIRKAQFSWMSNRWQK
jgi:hypothetical protein